MERSSATVKRIVSAIVVVAFSVPIFATAAFAGSPVHRRPCARLRPPRA